MGSLGSVGAYGAGLGPLNRSLGLGAPLLSPLGEGSRVEAYLAKVSSQRVTQWQLLCTGSFHRDFEGFVRQSGI